MNPAPCSPSSLLAQLVALPSVYPGADSGGTLPGEQAMSAWLEDFLTSLGASVKRHAHAEGRDTVVAEFPAPADAPVVVLAPHQDTVGVGGMTVPPFELTRKGNRLQGRGACDTKGPMASLLAALASWVKSGGPERTTVKWVVAATAAEEEGSLGAETLLREGFKADFAIALEPTDLRVVHGAKGLLRVWIEQAGVAAHSSKPERGCNAIHKLLDLAVALRDEGDALVGSHRHPALGSASMCLSVFEGGRELNLVPATARLGLDIRTVPGFDPEQAWTMLEGLVKRHAVSARMECLRRGPSFFTPLDHPVAQALRRVAVGVGTADWFCDANLFAARGIPAVAFGPGSIQQAHTHDEFITVEQLEAGMHAFRRLLDMDIPRSSVRGG